jgi:hypothetical protein
MSNYYISDGSLHKAKEIILNFQNFKPEKPMFEMIERETFHILIQSQNFGLIFMNSTQNSFPHSYINTA